MTSVAAFNTSHLINQNQGTASICFPFVYSVQYFTLYFYLPSLFMTATTATATATAAATTITTTNATTYYSTNTYFTQLKNNPYLALLWFWS